MNIVGYILDEKTRLHLPVVIARGDGFLGNISAVRLGDTSFFTGEAKEVRPYLAPGCCPIKLSTMVEFLAAIKFTRNKKTTTRCRRCPAPKGKYLADIILVAEGTKFPSEMLRTTHDYA